MSKSQYYIISSMYYSLHFRDKVIELIKNAENSKTIDDSIDIDLEILVKHSSHAKRLYEQKFVFLCILFIISTIGYFFLSIAYFIILGLIIYIVSYFFVTYKEFAWISFIKDKIKDKDLLNFEVKNYNGKLVETVRKYKASNIHYFQEYNPYRMYGFDVGGWSFPIDITKPNDASNNELTLPFNEDEVYDLIIEQLKKLNFENFETADCLFVNAENIKREKLFYSDESLLNQPDEEFINNFKSSKSEKSRFYKVVTIKDWNNELVFNILFRIYKSTENLYIETKFFVMPTLLHDVKRIDDFKSKLSLIRIIRILIGNLVNAPILLIASPFSILGSYLSVTGISRKISLWISDKDLLEKSIGNSVDVNMIFRMKYYETYFQSQDRDFYFKSVEKRILNTLIVFLEKHNIDVSDFKESKTHILNNGIMMTGGEMKGGNITVGSKNKIESK